MLSLVLAYCSSAHAEPATYTMDPGQSWLYVKVYNDPSGLASRLGHDHAIRAMDFKGEVVWDVDDPSACSVTFMVPVAELQPDPPGMRERAGLDASGAVGASSLETITENFLGANQLDAAKHPTIGFRSTSCAGTSGPVTVNGVMSLRGVDKKVSVSMNVTATGSAFTARGEVTMNHTDFGFKPFRALAGSLRNQDRLDFVIDVVGTQ